MNADTTPEKKDAGMSRATARGIEYSIIALCLVALGLIFQPYSLDLFGLGAVLVIAGGLAFNLVPMCVPGKPLSGVIRTAVIVVCLLVVISLLAIGSAYLYGVYLQTA